MHSNESSVVITTLVLTACHKAPWKSWPQFGSVFCGWALLQKLSGAPGIFPERGGKGEECEAGEGPLDHSMQPSPPPL